MQPTSIARRLAVASALLGTLLCLSSQALQAQYDPDAPEPIPRLKGTLFVGGGGEMPAEAYQRFVELAGGKNANIVVVSAGTATAAPSQEVLDGFLAHEPASVSTLHKRSRARANSDGFRESLQGATAAWIEADSGALFAEVFQGGEVEAELRALIARRGVIGGNGDVCRALARVMIAGGSPQASLATGLDIIPGAVIDVDFSGMNRRNRMLGVLASQPTLVGLGIDKDTSMVLHHRFIDVLGAGSVYGCVAASEQRPLRIEQLNREISPYSQRNALPRFPKPAARQPRGGGQRGARSRGQLGQVGGRGRGRGGQGAAGDDNQQPPAWRPRRLGDLMVMSRSAVARTRAPFPAEKPPEPYLENGTMIVVGGGGSPPGLTERFIELAGGPDALLVYIPCSEEEEITTEPRILEGWRKAGAKNVAWMHTKDRNKSNSDEEFLTNLSKAGGVWFGGGRQWNLVDSYQHTKAHKLMHDVLDRGGVIGGSSAGASIQGSYMVRGNSLGNMDPMAEGYDTGLGFLTGVAFDQHFTQRGRLLDMSALANTYPQLLGVGLDEASSIIIQGSVAEVFTREGRNAHFYDRTKPVIPGEPDYIQLVHGQRYDMRERKVVESVAELAEIAAAAAAAEANQVSDASAGKSSAVGTWEMRAVGGEGGVDYLVIAADMTAEYSSTQFEADFKVVGLKFENGSLTFGIEVADFGATLGFEGTIEADSLSGWIWSEEFEFEREVRGKRIAGK